MPFIWNAWPHIFEFLSNSSYALDLGSRRKGRNRAFLAATELLIIIKEYDRSAR